MDNLENRRSLGRVLVVDDDETFRRGLRRALVSREYEVLEAGSGEEALALLEQESVDVLVLDIMMPGIDGIETCRLIRQKKLNVHLPVLFVTAYDDKKSQIEGTKVGGDDYVIKPVDQIELVIRIQNLIETRDYHQHMKQERISLKQTVEEQSELLGKAMAEIGKANETLRRLNEEIIFRLSKAVEFRDDETANHVQRMSRFCGLIASCAGMNSEMSETVRLASALHDVGKISIPDSILRKPGRLNADEMSMMRTHTDKGYRMLSGSDSGLLELAAKIAWSHHERFDGTGYPRQLKGKEISFEGRIAAVADVFDALTSKRVYKAAFSINEAQEIIKKERGTGFDPQIVDILLDRTDDFFNIMIVYGDR
ncbi:MAG: response regulator [Proteobacteria bacterium]|nr:response regulator [Pseudomonadota bacterium]